VADWKNRIDRWEREETVLSNVWMLKEPVLQAYLMERNLMLTHPMQRDHQGRTKADTSKWLVKKRE